jgi:hypothetical protein
MFARAPLAAGTLLLLLLATPSLAGHNADGMAWLSWDSTGASQNLDAVGNAAFPLFVHVTNATDIRALGAAIRWYPKDSTGACYSLLPGAPNQSYGWATDANPHSSIAGDSSYTQTILLPPSAAGPTCFSYLISAATCSGSRQPADFILDRVIVLDTQGAVDTLQVLHGATIYGGYSPIVERVSVSELPAGSEARLVFSGKRLTAGTEVSLRGPHLEIAAKNVVASGSTSLEATVTAPNTPGSLMDVVARFPDGRSTSLSSAIAITAAAPVAPPPAGYVRPSNDSSAFHNINLNSDLTGIANASQHLQFNYYPTWLSTSALLVRRSPTDTMAILKSTPYDGIILDCGCQGVPSYVDYAVSPPKFFTSVGLLTMANWVFSGAGAFNDNNLPALTLTWTFDDGSTASQPVRVGRHVRNYRSGPPITCGVPVPLFVTPPDSLCAVISSTPLQSPPYQPGDLYYDAQELRLPTAYRSKKLAAIRVSAADHTHVCSGSLTHSDQFLYGLSIWPNFRVADGLGRPVSRVSQSVLVPHGGYRINGNLYGDRRTLADEACQVASTTMLYNYAGFACTLNDLNLFLQNNKGYEFDQVAVVTHVSPSANEIDFTSIGGTLLKAGDTFLVEEGHYQSPLATYLVTVAGKHGHATLQGPLHGGRLPQDGDAGNVYWSMRPGTADLLTTAPRLRTITLAASPGLPSAVESLLVRNIPVMVNVKNHCVVADGWTSSIRPDTTARGTYWIKDPYDPRNFTKLIEAMVNSRGVVRSYGNEYRLARYVVPVTGPDPQGTPLAQALAVGPSHIGILLDGARRIEITDPSGRTVVRDATTGEANDGMPNVIVEVLASEHDDTHEDVETITGFDLDIMSPSDGHYSVRAYADNGSSINVSAHDDAGIYAAVSAVDTSVAPPGRAFGRVYDVAVSGAGTAVAIALVGTLDAAPVPGGGNSIRVVRCPTSGPVQLMVSGVSKGDDAIEVFDVGGRKVGLLSLVASAGPQTVEWDWRSARCRPGVYLVRQRSQAGKSSRCVVLN